LISTELKLWPCFVYFKGKSDVSTETKTESSGLDTVKWVAAIVLLAAAIYGNHYLAQSDSFSLVIRVAAVAAVVVLALVVAATTNKGAEAITFAKESRMEVRKVVWPTRQESIQTTLIIVVFVVIVALFMWGVDTFLGWSVSKLMSL
jgi:preprotein translocase subunit SecE